MNNFEAGNRKNFPPEVQELVALYGSLRNIPIQREYDTPAGRQVRTLTVEQWMAAFCPEDPSGVSDDIFEEAAVRFILGEGHGQEST